MTREYFYIAQCLINGTQPSRAKGFIKAESAHEAADMLVCKDTFHTIRELAMWDCADDWARDRQPLLRRQIHREDQ